MTDRLRDIFLFVENQFECAKFRKENARTQVETDRLSGEVEAYDKIREYIRVHIVEANEDEEKKVYCPTVRL